MSRKASSASAICDGTERCWWPPATAIWLGPERAGQMRRRRAVNPKVVAVLVAGLLGIAGGVVAYALNGWPRVENDTVDMRFAMRGSERPPSDVVVVAIAARTFSD